MKQAHSYNLSTKILDEKLNSCQHFFLDKINLSPIWNQDLALCDQNAHLFLAWMMTSGAWTLPRINILHIFNYLSSSVRMPWSREHVSLSTSVKSSNKVVFLGSFPYCLYFGKHGVYHYHDCNSILLVVVVKILSYIEQEFRLLFISALRLLFLAST